MYGIYKHIHRLRSLFLANAEFSRWFIDIYHDDKLTSGQKQAQLLDCWKGIQQNLNNINVIVINIQNNEFEE